MGSEREMTHVLDFCWDELAAIGDTDGDGNIDEDEFMIYMYIKEKNWIGAAFMSAMTLQNAVTYGFLIGLCAVGTIAFFVSEEMEHIILIVILSILWLFPIGSLIYNVKQKMQLQNDQLLFCQTILKSERGQTIENWEDII